MTPERWKQLEDLYQAAAEQPPDLRAAFLAAACPDDEPLRRDVESLLAEGESSDGFLAEPASVRAAAMISALPAATMTGRTIGRYELRRLIGAGGMGEVYHSHDVTLGRDVAIKILPQAFTRDPDRLARLEREARMLAALHHPNICAIYGVEEAEGIRLLVLEYVDGTTLAERLTDVARPGSRHPGLTVDDALTIARQMADALEAAHEKGIIHRDLKPANIKITADGTVKVLDFGLAKSITAGGSPELTHAQASDVHGPIMGTAAYMSPEQARGLAVDRRTDIWAFGCVLYEMLTGRLAFPGDTMSDTIAKILEREPDWSALPSGTPSSIRRLLFRCLAKDPRQRLKDIADVRLEIDAVAEVVPGEPVTAPSPPRHGWLPWAALAVLALGVVVFELKRPVVYESPLAHANFTKLTNWAGTEAAAAISHDGKFVAFLSDRDGEFDIWVNQIGNRHFSNLTREMPALSPHGILRLLGFSGDGEVWFNPATEKGAPKLLVPVTGGTRRPILGPVANDLAWSSDGSRLVYFQGERGDPIFVADRMAADPVTILPPGSGGPHNHGTVWSTDDQWIYFLSGTVYGLNETDEMDIWRIRPSGGAPERLTNQQTDITALAPLDRDTLLYVGRGENREGPWLWALDVNTRVSRRATSGLEQYISVAASRDGRRVVATVADPEVHLWRVPLDRQAEERDVQPYIVPSAFALAPRFGGPSLFYMSSIGAGNGLWRLQGDEAAEIWQGSDGMLSEVPAVSPDGQQVALVLRRAGKQQLALMAADGTGRRVLAPSIDTQGTPDWSPDGATIVTGGRDADGPALFTIPVAGGAPARLVNTEARDPVWARDGRMILYSGPITAGRVSLAAVRPDGTPIPLPDLLIRPGSFRLLPDSSGVVYLGHGRSIDFWQFDFATNTSRQLTRLRDLGRLRSFDITPDGKQLVFDRWNQNSDVVLIDIPKKY